MVARSIPRRVDVLLVALEPTVGGVIPKTCPSVVISPDEMYRHVRTVLDRRRAVDGVRLAKRLGVLSARTQAEVLRVLAEMFAP